MCQQLLLTVIWSAVVCSILRLKATVDLGASSDTLYNIGPVVLWATGEMTCGFFVACATSLPRAFQENPLIRRIKKTLGLRTSPTTSNMEAKRSVYGTRDVGTHKMSRGTASHNAYLQMDEDGIPMRGLQASDPIGHLRTADQSDRITRTTHIVISRDQQYDSDHDSNSTPWAKQMKREVR